mgnify:CR=1 FL=1
MPAGTRVQLLPANAVELFSSNLPRRTTFDKRGVLWTPVYVTVVSGLASLLFHMQPARASARTACCDSHFWHVPERGMNVFHRGFPLNSLTGGIHLIHLSEAVEHSVETEKLHGFGSSFLTLFLFWAHDHRQTVSQVGNVLIETSNGLLHRFLTHDLRRG